MHNYTIVWSVWYCLYLKCIDNPVILWMGKRNPLHAILIHVLISLTRTCLEENTRGIEWPQSQEAIFRSRYTECLMEAESIDGHTSSGVARQQMPHPPHSDSLVVQIGI